MCDDLTPEYREALHKAAQAAMVTQGEERKRRALADMDRELQLIESQIQQLSRSLEDRRRQHLAVKIERRMRMFQAETT